MRILKKLYLFKKYLDKIGITVYYILNIILFIIIYIVFLIAFFLLYENWIIRIIFAIISFIVCAYFEPWFLSKFVCDFVDYIRNKFKKSIIKKTGLPTKGKIRYIPPEKWNLYEPLPKGNKGYIDKFKNEWIEGPSRTENQSFEWDVQLSRQGKSQIGWLTRGSSHVNVSLDGKITHE